MENFIETNREEKRQNLQVWHCENCQVVHFKTDNVLLGFTKTEFADLTHTMMELYQKQFGNLEFYDLLNMVRQTDDILVSQSVS